MKKDKYLVCYAHVTNSATFIAELTDKQLHKLLDTHTLYVSVIRISDMKRAALYFKNYNEDEIKFTNIDEFTEKNDKALRAISNKRRAA